MNADRATWALKRHVSATLAELITRQVGVIRGWPPIRMIWLSGCLSDRRVPDQFVAVGNATKWVGMWVPESDHARN